MEAILDPTLEVRDDLLPPFLPLFLNFWFSCTSARRTSSFGHMMIAQRDDLHWKVQIVLNMESLVSNYLRCLERWVLQISELHLYFPRGCYQFWSHVNQRHKSSKILKRFFVLDLAIGYRTPEGRSNTHWTKVHWIRSLSIMFKEWISVCCWIWQYKLLSWPIKCQDRSKISLKCDERNLSLFLMLKEAFNGKSYSLLSIDFLHWDTSESCNVWVRWRNVAKSYELLEGRSSHIDEFLCMPSEFRVHHHHLWGRKTANTCISH